jgi:hypothetical protein
MRKQNPDSASQGFERNDEMKMTIKADGATFDAGTTTTVQQIEKILKAGQWLRDHRPQIAIVIDGDGYKVTSSVPSEKAPVLSDGVRIVLDELVEHILEP